MHGESPSESATDEICCANDRSRPPQACFSTVPAQLLGIVFGFLRPRAVLCRCRVVCKKWSTAKVSWPHLVLRNLAGTNLLLTAIHCSQVQSVMIATSGSETGWILSSLSQKVPHLTQVHVSRLTDEVVSCLLRLPALRTLILTYNVDATRAQLRALKDLQELDSTTLREPKQRIWAKNNE